MSDHPKEISLGADSRNRRFLIPSRRLESPLPQDFDTLSKSTRWKKLFDPSFARKILVETPDLNWRKELLGEKPIDTGITDDELFQYWVMFTEAAMNDPVLKLFQNVYLAFNDLWDLAIREHEADPEVFDVQRRLVNTLGDAAYHFYHKQNYGIEIQKCCNLLWSSMQYAINMLSRQPSAGIWDQHINIGALKRAGEIRAIFIKRNLAQHFQKGDQSEITRLLKT